MNVLAFSGTNYFFSKLRDHGEKKTLRKVRNLALEKLQRVRNKCNEDNMKPLELSIQGCVNGMKQSPISAMLMKQYLVTITYLRNK